MIPFVQSIKQLVLSSSQPIGSIVIRTDNVNPSTIYGGTWEQIEDTFLLACGSRYNNGATGGEFTHTLTVEEIPSHTHTFTGTAHSHGLNEHTHTIPAHAHGLNSHTHTYAKPNSPTGAASGNTGSTTLTVNQIPSHNHVQNMGDNNMVAGSGSHHTSTQVYGEFADNTVKATAYQQITTNTGGGQGHTHTLNNHTHTVGTTSTNTGAASGNTANSSELTSGKASGNTANATQGGTNSNTGGGQAFNITPKYLAVYVWKRIA